MDDRCETRAQQQKQQRTGIGDREARHVDSRFAVLAPALVAHESAGAARVHVKLVRARHEALDEQIAAGEEIKAWLDNEKPYTDNACIKGDLSPEMINKAREMGIEPSGDNPGQDWKSSVSFTRPR